jgi:hypothetical protein
MVSGEALDEFATKAAIKGRCRSNEESNEA